MRQVSEVESRQSKQWALILLVTKFREDIIVFKWAIFGLSFLILSFNTVDSRQMFNVFFCRRLVDSRQMFNIFFADDWI